MTYKQLHDADMTVGYEGGWCLKYVQDAFHTDHPYPNAMAAWNADYGNGNHAEEPALGMTVPIYLSINGIPEGHVAIRLDDGYVASSTMPGHHATPYYHKNIQDLIDTYTHVYGGMTLLGWSEYVGTEHVVEALNLATVDQIKQAYLDILERPADAGGIAHYQSYTIDFVRNDLTASPEHAALMANKAAAAQAAVEAAAQAKAEADAKAAANAAAEKAKQDAIDQQAVATAPALQSIQNVVDTVNANNSLLKQILSIVQTILSKLTSVFK